MIISNSQTASNRNERPLPQNHLSSIYDRVGKCFDWYFIAAINQWYPGRSLHLPSGERWFFTACDRRCLLEFMFDQIYFGILTGDHKALQEVTDWMFLHLSPERDSGSIINTWGEDFITLLIASSYESHYIRPTQVS